MHTHYDYGPRDVNFRTVDTAYGPREQAYCKQCGKRVVGVVNPGNPRIRAERTPGMLRRMAAMFRSRKVDAIKASRVRTAKTAGKKRTAEPYQNVKEPTRATISKKNAKRKRR